MDCLLLAESTKITVTNVNDEKEKDSYAFTTLVLSEL